MRTHCLRKITLSLAVALCLLWPAPGQAQTIAAIRPATATATLTTTTCPGSGCVPLNLGGYGSVAVQLTGTWTGTINFETTLDGTNWVAVNMTPSNSNVAVTTATANGIWYGTVLGSQFRARFNPATSGSVVVRLSSTLTAAFNLGGGSGLPAGVAVGQILVSNGVGAGGLWSPTPVLGVAASQAGTLGLAKGVGGGAVWTLASAATSAWTLTGAATAPAQGDLLTFSNATGQMSSVVDVAAGSYLRSGGANLVPIYSTVTLPNTVATGNILIASASNVVSALTPGSIRALPVNQTGNATATLKMDGLGAAAAPCIITPATSGRVGFAISGQAVQTTTADGITYLMAFGTGTPPANAAAASGTIISAQQTHTALTGLLETPFSLTAIATGLSLVATWFDIQVANVTGGTASITNVTCTAWEF